MKDLKKKIKKVYYYHENTHLESLNNIYIKKNRIIKKGKPIKWEKEKRIKEIVHFKFPNILHPLIL